MSEKKLDAITPLLGLRRVPRDGLVSRAKEVGCAPKTLRAWLRRYRKDPGLSSLARRPRSDINKSRFDGPVEAELDLAMQRLLSDGNLTLQNVHDDLKDRVKALAKLLGWRKWKTLSYGTLYNRYLKVSERDKAEATFGARRRGRRGRSPRAKR